MLYNEAGSTVWHPRGLISSLQQPAIWVPDILASILTLKSFQLLSIPLLLSLLWFLPLGVHLSFLIPFSSCGLLSSGISTSPLGVATWPTRLRHICPYLASRQYSISDLLGTNTKDGLGFPSPTKFCAFLLSLQQVAHCTLLGHTDRQITGEEGAGRSHLASSAGLWQVSRGLWQCFLLRELFLIFLRKRQRASSGPQNASLTTRDKACSRSVKA